MRQLFNKNSKLMPSPLQFVHFVMLQERIFNIFSSFTLTLVNVGESYSHLFRFRGCLAFALKTIYFQCSVTHPFLKNRISYGLMQSKHCYWNFVLKEIREFSMITYLAWSDLFASAWLLASSWLSLSAFHRLFNSRNLPKLECFPFYIIMYFHCPLLSFPLQCIFSVLFLMFLGCFFCCNKAVHKLSYLYPFYYQEIFVSFSQKKKEKEKEKWKQFNW